MSAFSEYFRAQTRILKHQYEQSSGINHNLTAGECREVFIEEFLSDLYPEEYLFGDGEIIDSSNNVSPQTDIVIYDSKAPVLPYGGSNHFLAEGTLAHLEIKSDLSGSVNDVLSKTAATKSLEVTWDVPPQIPQPPQIFSGAFAFEGPNPETVLEEFGEFYGFESTEFTLDKTDIDHWGEVINVICVLDEYFFYKHTYMDQSGETRTTLQLVDSGEDSLAAFFVFLAGSVFRGMGGKPDLQDYMSVSEFEAYPAPWA